MSTSLRSRRVRAAHGRITTIRVAAVIALAVSLLVLPGIAGYSADIPIATIPVGDAPVAVAVNPLSHRVYVANYYGSSVSVIDGVSDTVTATVGLGDFSVPISVIANPVASPPRAYVANFWDNTISVIDESTSELTATVPSNGVHAGGPRSLALNPSGATPKLYVAEYGSGLVTVLNAETYELIATVPVGSYPRALGIFSSVARTRIYVANGASNTVSIIDGDTDAVVATVDVGVAPKAIAVDTTTGYAYVTNEDDDTVTVIDDSDSVTATVQVGDRPIGIAVDETAGRVFVANYNVGTVSVLDTADFSHEATLTVGTRPWAIAFDQGDEKAFVTNYGGGSVSVIDAALTVQTVPSGSGPYSVAVDEGATPHKTYVGNWSSDNVTVIDEPLVPQAFSFLPATSAYAAEEPVAVAIDPTVDTSGGTVLVHGTATDMRTLYPAAIAAVFYRVAPSSSWIPAAITAGANTIEVEWTADLGALEDGSYELEVIALDQTGAASAVSDGGTAVTSAAIGGAAVAQIEIGAEPCATTTALDLVPATPPAYPTLTASVRCEETDCGEPQGDIVFEQLLGADWVEMGTVTLTDASASLSVPRSTRGTFRACYVGDDTHLASTSAELVISSGTGTNAKRNLVR